MANKIFVSYKYGDRNVFPLKSKLEEIYDPTTVRTYVDQLENYFDKTEYAIYKGESDDEDLSHLSDDEIWGKLKNRIFDSTVTIVIISPCMKESNRHDKSQWIPWEVSYSLKETTRNNRTSYSNALLAVVLPDLSNDYSYFWTDRQCRNCSCYFYNFNTVFDILKDNMMNKKNKTPVNCHERRMVYSGELSYIKVAKWSDFIAAPQEHINKAIEIKKRIDDYEIRKEV